MNYLGWKDSFITYTINLNQYAQNGKLDPIASRDKEINQIINILSRRNKNSVLLIGEAGTGKTALIEGLAQKIIQGQVPKSLLGKEIIQLDFPALVAGAKHPGEFEQRFIQLIADILDTNNTILFIDDIHLLMESQTDGTIKAADLLKKHLDHGQFPVIGITTPAQYNKYIDSDKAFERIFQVITVEEPSDEDTFQMIQIQKSKYESYHDTIITDEAIRESIRLSKKYVQGFLPDKAIDLLDEASVIVKLHNQHINMMKTKVTNDDIAKLVSEWTKIPVTKLTLSEAEKMIHLEQYVHKDYIDQKPAVTVVADAIRRGRTGLSSSNQPLASFFFLGTSGTGKSELVKILSKILFENDNALMQIDMSEYMEKNDVAKLIGAPPGYVGYDDGGILTEAVKKTPSMIILFDNIEKAHPDLTNILHQILEEGSLTDNHGKKVNFKNTIIICTTSVGNDLIYEKLSSLGGSPKEEDVDTLFNQMQPMVRDELTKYFTPELINRFDAIVSFKPLSFQVMSDISRLMVYKTAKLLREQDFMLQITDSALSKLASDGYSPKTGARQIRKLVTEKIVNPLAVAVISKEFESGDIILIDFATHTGFILNKNASELLQKIQIKIPKIKDLAKYDLGHNHNDKTITDEMDTMLTMLKKITNADSITDPNEKVKIEELKTQLFDEKEKGNPTAHVIVFAAQTINQPNTVAQSIPQINGIQIVNDEDFEEVTTMWLEYYENIKNDSKSIDTHIDFLKQTIAATEKLLEIFHSTNRYEKLLAVHEISHIVPFVVMGGFTTDEINLYLKTKIEACNRVLELLNEEKIQVPAIKPIDKQSVFYTNPLENNTKPVTPVI